MSTHNIYIQGKIKELKSHLKGSNIYGTMEIFSRHGQFEPLRVNHIC